MRLLLIDIDSLRPDHLGCYGYPRATSPAIDRLAAEGIRFTRCFASDTPCMPSRAGMITGRFGVHHGVVGHHHQGQHMRPNYSGYQQMPDLRFTTSHLNRSGLYSASFSSFCDRHQAWWFAAAWREYHSVSLKNGFETYAEVNREVLPWLERNAVPDNWLLHVNYWDVHEPYRLTERRLAAEVAASGPRPAWPDEAAIASQQGMTGLSCATLLRDPPDESAVWPTPRQIKTRADFDHLCDGYDAAIKNVDDGIAELLAELERQHVLDGTAVIVTADHGDALGEHGLYADHVLAHSPCQRVPLILHWPGITDRPGAAGTENAALIYQFDVMATICDLLGVDRPAGWDAQPFTAALHGQPFAGRPELVCGHGLYMFSRALYAQDNWCYIRLLHPGVFNFPGLYGQTQRELLHNLAADPHQTRNLIDEEPQRAQDMRARLDAWVARQTAGIRDPLADMVPFGPDEYYSRDEYLRRLVESGRVEAALTLLN
jgi:arylsulfatase A-like enzyme